MMTHTCDYLIRAIGLCLDAGVTGESIIVDPGIGFGKTPDQNLEILQRLHELKVLGLPILLGTSRKSFIGAVLDLPVAERLAGTLATEAIGIAHGASIVRVHDVAASAQAARMRDAIIRRRTHGK
jgi:dihydropteroate synthase